MNKYVQILNTLLSLTVGIVVALLLRSLIAGVVIGWYFWSLGNAVMTTVRTSCRHTRWIPLLVHLIGAPLAFFLAYLIAPLPVALCLAVLLLLTVESLYRAWLRRWQPERFAVSPTVAVPSWHGWAALVGALALVLLLPITLYAYVARQTLADVRVWARGFNRWGVYETLLDLVAQELPGAVRKQPLLTRYALSGLDPAVRHEALTALLPPHWSAAVALQTVERMLEWLQTEDAVRVPMISFPVGEAILHAKRALSIALDDYVDDLATCPEGIVASARCRPAEMSPVAYTATFKPEALAALDEALALIPADVDLSTAVTLSPATFKSSLAALGRLRAGLAQFDRLLRWAGLACVLIWGAIWLLGASSPRAGLCWSGIALFVAGARAWSLSWLATAFASALSALAGPVLKPPLDELAGRAVNDLLQLVYIRSLLPAALCALGGLILVVIGQVGETGSLLRKKALNLFIFLISLIYIFWHGYLSVGRDRYGQAVALHRDGDSAAAVRIYQALTTLYPFVVDPFVTMARQGLLECQRDQAAQRAFEAQDFWTAIQIDQALLVAAPSFALRERAEARLIAALNAEAERLWMTAHPERALDLYRWLAQGGDDRSAQRNLAQRCLEWGVTLEELGDYAGATATYLRVIRETNNARLWIEARTRAAAAYCAWAQALRTDVRPTQAEQICARRAVLFQPAEIGHCSACD